MNNYELFIKVVELQSFSAAAKALHKTPSAISKQIQTLEAKLGAQLLNRTTRSLSITEAGKLYYQRCLEIVQHIESTEEELKDLTGTLSGRLKVTWPSVLSCSPIITSLGEFTKHHSGIKIDTHITNERIDLVQEGFDFGIRTFWSEDLSDSSLVALKVGDIQSIFCISPTLIKDIETPKSLAEILKLPLIIPTYMPLAQALKKIDPNTELLDEKKHHKANDLFAVYNLLKAGIGGSFIAKHVVAKELDEGSLINLTGDHLPKFPVYLVYPKLNYQPKIQRCFIDHFKHYFSEKAHS